VLEILEFIFSSKWIFFGSLTFFVFANLFVINILQTIVEIFRRKKTGT